MKAIAKTRKIGGSLVVTIPKTIVNEISLHENQTIEINIKKVRKSGFGILKGKGPFIEERKLKGNVEKNDWIRY